MDGGGGGGESKRELYVLIRVGCVGCVVALMLLLLFLLFNVDQESGLSFLGFEFKPRCVRPAVGVVAFALVIIDFDDLKRLFSSWLFLLLECL